MHFCTAEHFPLENVRKNAFLQRIKCICNILLVLNILQSKMFSKTKCDAEHFPKENVRKNAFLHQIYFCKASNAFLHSQNAFVTFCVTKCDAKISFCKASNAFVTFCFAEHFPLENVQHLCFLQSKKHSILASKTFLHHILLCQMLQIYFCITFCEKMTFCKISVK